jgi:hypothetical protein
MNHLRSTVTIRSSYPDDEAAIVRLAALDSAAVPAWPFLLAEVEGELRAALSLSSGRAIADPFEQTVRIVEMLRTYAGPVLRDERPTHARTRGRRLGRLALEF